MVTNYQDYFLTFTEYQQWKEGETPQKLVKIWEDVVEKIPYPELKEEAEKKGFELVDNPDIEDDPIAFYMKFHVLGASKELKDYWIGEAYPYVICLKE